MKKIVFRMGADAGFFSEYNNMLLTYHYCLVNNIEFIMSSKNANFSTTKKGWTDFFEPFCPEYKFPLLSIYNTRLDKPVFRNFKDKLLFTTYTWLNGIDYYTYDLFRSGRRMSPNVIFEIEKFSISGKLLDNCCQLNKKIWKYNKKTQIEINELLNRFKLPEHYIAMHIRLGDKSIEHDLFDEDAYMEKILNKNIYYIFVLTDDYTVIDRLIEKYPSYSFTTLCNQNSRGYSHVEFTRKLKSERRKDLLNLFASMDIMEKADYFVGTFSSNPGMNMGFRMPKDKMIGLDYGEWLIW